MVALKMVNIQSKLIFTCLAEDAFAYPSKSCRVNINQDT